MARPNPHKKAYYQALSAPYSALKLAAIFASDTDRAAVECIEKALAFANQWTRNSCDSSRKHMAVHMARLADKLPRDPESPLQVSMLAYRAALQAFEANDYASSLKLAALAARALKSA